MSAPEIALIVGTCGGDVYARASRRHSLALWRVHLDSGASVPVRAQWTRLRRTRGGILRLRLTQITLADLRQIARHAYATPREVMP